MVRKKGDGAKVSKKKNAGNFDVTFKEKNWKDIEQILDVSLSDDIKGKFKTVAICFGGISRLHTAEQTVSSRDAVAALNAWIKSSKKIRIQLGDNSQIAPLKKEDVFSCLLDKRKIKSLGKMPILQFFDFILALAIGVALSTIVEIPRQQFDPKLKSDLWLVWVRLVILIVEELGIKPTASSSNKGTESPFVKLLLYMHGLLPPYCRRFVTYESVVKGVQMSKAKFGGDDYVICLAILAGLGSGILNEEMISKLRAGEKISLPKGYEKKAF